MVISTALKTPSVFVFGELLAEPNVQEVPPLQSPDPMRSLLFVRLQLDDGEFKPWLDLLRVFAYGTYADYKGQC